MLKNIIIVFLVVIDLLVLLACNASSSPEPSTKDSPNILQEEPLPSTQSANTTAELPIIESTEVPKIKSPEPSAKPEAFIINLPPKKTAREALLFMLENSKVVDKIIEPGDGVVFKGVVVAVDDRTIVLQKEGDTMSVWMRENENIPEDIVGKEITILGMIFHDQLEGSKLLMGYIDTSKMKGNIKP